MTPSPLSSSFKDSSTDNAPGILLLSERYYRRLKLDPTTLDDGPTLAKLKTIFEAHVTEIPFENTAQHGVIGGLQSLNLHEIAYRVLDCNRGGFCFELNGLLCHWLEHELQYKGIHCIAAQVGVENGIFRQPATHMLPFCRTIDDNFTSQYIIDVACGEASIHPLQYVFDIVQITPEGMISKITKDDTNEVVILHWYKENQWIGRFQWNYNDSITCSSGLSLESFAPALEYVQQPEHRFSQKLIVCKVSRTHKFVLAGKRLKITGPPRFTSILPTEDGENGIINNDNNNVTTAPPIATTTIQDLETDVNVRMVLQDIFGIPLESTTGFNLEKSITADPSVWCQI